MTREEMQKMMIQGMQKNEIIGREYPKHILFLSSNFMI